MYVLGVDAEKNTVTLGSEEVFTWNLVASDLNFISIDHLENEMYVSAKIRYSAKESSALIKPNAGRESEGCFRYAAKGCYRGNQ